ncbi:MAG TPA: hypothetical protein VK875_01965 [Euzebyales bacterium]|nr:hypothetical protein [Euzebyales bacterium]
MSTVDPDDRLLASEDRDDLDRRWTAIETGFVEDPRRHIELADDLLGDLVARLQARMQADRDRLSAAWRSGDATTEQLRELLLRYRAAYLRLREVTVPRPDA